MKPIVPGTPLSSLGMRLVSDLGKPGLIGKRWAVQLLEPGLRPPHFENVADIIEVTDSSLDACCDHIAELAGVSPPRGIVGLIGAEWINDSRFIAVWDLPTTARSLDSILCDPDFRPANEDDFWFIAASLFRSLTELHRDGVPHGCLCPNTVYATREGLFIHECWWMSELCQSAGLPLAERIPRAAQAFAAPEVIIGGPPSRERDLYSLGMILKRILMPGEPQSPTKGDRARQTGPLASDATPEIVAFVDALLNQDPGARPPAPIIGAQLNERLLQRLTLRWPQTWQFELCREFWSGLHRHEPGCCVEMFDAYQFQGLVMLGFRLCEAENWFNLQGLLRSCGRTYLALSYSPERTDRCAVEPFTVVCLERDWSIRILDEPEFEAVQDELRENIMRGAASDQAYRTFLFGPIREELPAVPNWPDHWMT